MNDRIPMNTTLEEYLYYHVDSDDPIQDLIDQETVYISDLPEPIQKCIEQEKDIQNFLDEELQEERERIAEELHNMLTVYGSDNHLSKRLRLYIENMG